MATLTGSGAGAGVERAIAAANSIFDDPRAILSHEPRGIIEVSAAVNALTGRFRAAGGTLNEMIKNAAAAAEVLSDDPFQALSEIIQNADDVGATEVHITLVGSDLDVLHDGRPLTLRDAHALAAPWLTTKRDDSDAVGRFGIGLMTLKALADAFEMHSGDYHVQFGSPTIAVVDSRSLPTEAKHADNTLLHVPLRDATRAGEQLIEWADRWDDSALLFLRSVRTVHFTTASLARSLSLVWQDASESNRDICGAEVTVRRRHAHSSDDRRWVVHDTTIPTPKGVHRANKANDATTSLAIALGLSGQLGGMLYAGLPIASTDLSVHINAQFDPTASRRDIASTDWNRALLSPVSELWAAAVLSLFAEDAQAAWRVVPVNESKTTAPAMVQSLTAVLLEAARSLIADNLNLKVRGQLRWIGDLAHEVPELEGQLTDSEIAQLAGLDATLPTVCRDNNGRWRDVLDDWRNAGNEIAVSVDINDALRLFTEAELPAERAIQLFAIALEHGHEEELASTKCVTVAGGSRVQPPPAHSLNFLVKSSTGLARQLGLGTALDPAHLNDDGNAQQVMTWLVQHGSVLPDDDSAVLARLVQASDAGTSPPLRLDDLQIVALRNAVEAHGQGQTDELLASIGRTILLDGFKFDDRGRRRPVETSPALAYIAQTIDKESDSFAVAADKTPEIIWIADRYAKVLKSPRGRQGLGALRFLRQLGAQTAPRVVPHPGLEKKYSRDEQRGLSAWHPGSPEERRLAIDAMGGNYTLDDTHSPDLHRVLTAIASDDKPTRRRRRAAALIATFGRTWSGLDELTEVPVVSAHHGWNHSGITRSWWMWQASTTAWLDNDDNKPSRPLDLRLRTPATLALYGTDRSGYLHPSFRESRVNVLEALGVVGEPNTADLCERLVSIRDTEADDGDNLKAEIAGLYKAIADRVKTTSRIRGDLTTRELRQKFDDGSGLVHTALGWRKPGQVFTGQPIFGHWKPFTPAITGVDQLWKTLNIIPPATHDCIDVLESIAQDGAPPTPATQTIVLETMRELARLLKDADPAESDRKRLEGLRLWTTKGWRQRRPIYAVEDPVLATGLADQVPVWQPGGEISQFAHLFDPLRLVKVPATAGDVVEPSTYPDEDLTALFQSSVKLLHDDLVRNDPATASALRVPWTEFKAFEVAIISELAVRVPDVLTKGEPAIVAADAKADVRSGFIYLRNGDLLGKLDGGGRAVAGLFNADHRRVAQAWLAAMEGAAAHLEAAGLRLAEEIAAEELRRNDEMAEKQLTAFQQQVQARGKASKKKSVTPAAPSILRVSSPPPASPAVRKLVDPSQLRVLDSAGEIVSDNSNAKPSEQPTTRPLRTPVAGAAGPQQRSRLRGYTDLEKETIGLQLVRQVLQSDDVAISDLRAQRGVGADAMDELQQFYELKVYAGSEPDEIRMSANEVQRAITSSHFFLVIVSGVEDGSPEHKVRVIAQPLLQLKTLDPKDMRLGGVKKAQSLIYRLTSD